MTKRITYDKERFSVNVARLKKGGENFEVVINSEEAIEFKNGEKIDITDAVVNEEVFTDAKKGMLAPEEKMEELFGTKEPLEVAKIILKEGEIQLTTEYRKKLREQKLQRIIGIIHSNAIDGRTGLPLPVERIKNAIEEKKIHVDEFKSVGSQIDDVVDKIKELIPIKFGKEQLKIIVPATHAAKAFHMLKEMTDVTESNWLNDGKLEAYVEITAAKAQELIEKLENMTHGGAEIKQLT